ncbi:SDR family oxidoreductase [Aquamicrobium soli]|uniref:SDR family oxidoreductase n=1 Tax=Aquamicrobium soli TaxID=1811518 RepID=A0ABV7KDT5_9HYPH
MAKVSDESRPVCLVTGGALRLGAAIATHLAALFDLAIHYRSSGEDAEQLARALLREGGRAEIFRADLADPAQAAGLIPEIVQRLGRVDLVVSSASLFDYDNPADFSTDAMLKSLAVNLVAPMTLGRELARAGTPQATLVHMLDSKVFSPNPDFFSYSLAKMALKSAIDMQAMQFRGRVRVCGIAPSVTLISGDQTPENFEKSWRHTLTGSGPTPQDIAGAVEFIWNTRSLNGSILTLDGGQHLMGLQRDVAFVVE